MYVLAFNYKFPGFEMDCACLDAFYLKLVSQTEQNFFAQYTRIFMVAQRRGVYVLHLCIYMIL